MLSVEMFEKHYLETEISPDSYLTYIHAQFECVFNSSQLSLTRVGGNHITFEYLISTSTRFQLPQLFKRHQNKPTKKTIGH